MTDIPTYAAPGFPPVPVIEEGDYVEGGLDGVDNLPHQRLAERTEFLRQHVDGAEVALADHAGRLGALERSDAGAVARALGLYWLYSDQGFAVELFAGRYVLRDLAPVGGVATVAGDDSVDVASTAGLHVGRAYAIVTAAGLAAIVEVAELLSPTRLRAVAAVPVTVAGAVLAPTSWDVQPGRAVAPPGSVYLSAPVEVLRYYDDGRVMIRRDTGDGVLAVSWRHPGGAWTAAGFVQATEREAGARDEEWAVDGGVIEIMVTVAPGPSGAATRIDHVAVCVSPLAGVAPFVQRPAAVAPADGTVGVGETPTLEGTAFRSLYGLAQQAAQVQIAASDDFTAPTHDAAIGAGVAYTVPAGALSTATVYFWRLRYRDVDGNWSAWSAPAGFTTTGTFRYVRRPTNVAPAAGATGVSVTPTLQSSPFAVANGADTHVASQWRVATDAGFTAVVHDSGEVGDLTSHVVAAPLATVTTYVFSVRHKGATLGWSEWSTPTSFTAQARAAAPMNGAPADGATGVSPTPTLQISAFFILGGADTHTKSQYQIATDAAFAAVVYDSGETADLTSHTVPVDPDIADLTTYHWRARHKGAATGWGPWSAPTTFTTAAPAGEQTFTASGTFTVPVGVTSVSVVCIGGGGGSQGNGGGGGGGLRWKNDIAVMPGQQIPVTVGAPGAGALAPDGPATAGGSSSFGAFVTAYGGGVGTALGGVGGGGAGGDGGGNGGDGGTYQGNTGCGGGGAGGYAGNGGHGGSLVSAATAGAGGGGGGGGTYSGVGGDARAGAGGGGVGLNGAGPHGAAGGASGGGGGGSGGGNGFGATGSTGGGGGAYGGGGGGDGGDRDVGGSGGGGAVRVIWGAGRRFPDHAA